VTGTDIVTRVRARISDEIATYRWSPEKLLMHINDARREISRLHPEARYVTEVVVDALEDMATLGEDCGLTADFNNAVLHYVCHRCLSEDSEDAANQAFAVTEYQLFEKEMA